MKVLKGFGVSILSLLLFLSLSVFGIAFMLNSTLLNPDFVTAEVDRVDITSLVTETIKGSGQGQDGLSPEMETSLLDTIDKLEPELKRQVGAAIYPVYDYLQGKKQELRLAVVLSDTVASNGFIVSVINNFDTASLVKEIISGSDSQKPGVLPKELSTAVVNTLTKLEPQLKKEVGAAIFPINDYLWGKRQDLSLAVVLSNTILRRDFVVTVVNEMDLAALTKDYIAAQLTGAIPEDYQEETEYLTRSLDVIITKLEPWLKQQVTIATGPGLDYLLGKSQTVNVPIPLEPALKVVKDTMKDALLTSPFPKFARMSEAQQEQYFENFFTQFTKNLPSTFVFDEKMLGSTRNDITRALAQAEEQLSKARYDLAQGLTEAETPLAQARRYIGYFQTYYYALIGFMVLLVLGIVLINRNVRDTARGLGINFLIYGALEFAGVYVARNYAPVSLLLPDIPSSLQTWLVRLYGDLLAPLQTFSIGLLIAGAVLIIVSFVYRPRVAGDQIKG